LSPTPEGAKNQQTGTKSQARRQSLRNKSRVLKARAARKNRAALTRSAARFLCPWDFLGVFLVMPGKARCEKTRPMSF
jgi:hypothetical protein